MSSPDPQAQLAALRAEHNRLTTAVTLQHKQAALQSLEQSLTDARQAIQKLTQSGYAGGATLTSHLQTLTAQLAQVRGVFAQVLAAASARLQAELGQANLGVGGALGGQTALVAPSVAALQTLSQRVVVAEEQLDAVLDSVSEAGDNLDSVLNVLSWSVEEWNEFSGDRNGSGALIIASEAEWKQTGRGKDDPDGVLYLTDKALIFEQKEKKGKTLGLFGGKQVQEVEWSIPLSQITDVRSKNEGMFGGRDILFLTVSGGDPAPEVKVELKGSSENTAWLAFIAKTKQGASILDEPTFTAPHLDLSAWSGPLPVAAAGFNLGALGGALAGMGAGVKAGEPHAHSDEKPKEVMKGGPKSGATGGSVGAMKGLAQSGSASDDDDEDKKPSGNASGGHKPS